MNFRELMDIANKHSAIKLTESTCYTNEFDLTRMTKLAGLSEELLLENRIQWLRDNVMHKLQPLADQEGKSPEEIFDWVLSLDPDPKKKNTQWLFNILVGKHGRSGLNDLRDATQVLEQFDKLKKSGALDKKFHDLSQFKSINALKNTLDAAEKSQESAENVEYKRALNQSDLIEDSGDYLIISPNTVWAAQYWGRESKWCTAYGDPQGRYPSRTNSFDEYDRSGDVYVFWHKQDPQNSFQLFVPKSIHDQKYGFVYELKDINNEDIPKETEEKLRTKIPALDELIERAEKTGTVSINSENFTADDFYELIEEFKNSDDLDYDYYDSLIEEGTIVEFVLGSGDFPEIDAAKAFLKYAINQPDRWEEFVLSKAPHNAEMAGLFVDMFKNGEWREYERSLINAAIENEQNQSYLGIYMREVEPSHWKHYREYFASTRISTAWAFAVYVLKKPMPEIEQRLINADNARLVLDYIKKTNRGEWKEAEELFAKQSSDYYMKYYHEIIGRTQ